jgi:hypothetical protein
MSDIGERIAAWEAAGLIDAKTADRLRAAEAVPAGTGVAPEPVPAAQPTEGLGPTTAAAWFGPGVTIPEVFGYLGAGFLLAGWSAFVVRIAGDRPVIVGAGALFAAVVLVALGAWLRTGDARRSRAAGVAFVVGVAFVGGGFATLATYVEIDGPLIGVVGTGWAAAAAVLLRAFHPSVLTQAGLLAALTSLAGALLAWAESRIVPPLTFTDDGLAIRGGPDPALLAVATAAWWLALAVAIGLIGLRESRAAERGNRAAERRASLTRFWAGLVAVLGLASALTRSDYDAGGEFRRAIAPWVGDLALVAVSAILVERAFRRDTTAYVYPAALGLILALSDVNVSYLSSGTEVALLVEGFILLGVGLAADRLRRRIGAPVRSVQAPTTGPPSTTAGSAAPATGLTTPTEADDATPPAPGAPGG